jgi:hypothetical protein
MQRLPLLDPAGIHASLSLAATLWRKSMTVRMQPLLALGAVSVCLACSDERAHGTPTADQSSAAPEAPPSVPDYAYVINTKDPSVTVLERHSQSILRSVELVEDAGVESGHFGTVTSDGRRLWLCSDLQNKTAVQGAMKVYDTDTFSVEQRFEVGCGVQNALSPGGHYLFASSMKTKAIDIYDVNAESLLGTFDIASAPHVGDFSSDGSVYYTSNANGGHLLGYDTTVLPGTLPLPLIYDQFLGNLMVHAVRVHPNDRYVFVGAGNATLVIELATQRILFQVPGHPHNIAISVDGRTLAIGDYTEQRLTLLDIATLDEAEPDASHIVERFNLPTPNFGVSHQSWDPVTGKLWVTLIRTVPDDARGILMIVNTEVDPPIVEKTLQIGNGPHGILFPGKKCE